MKMSTYNYNIDDVREIKNMVERIIYNLEEIKYLSYHLQLAINHSYDSLGSHMTSIDKTLKSFRTSFDQASESANIVDKIIHVVEEEHQTFIELLNSNTSDSSTIDEEI